MVLNLTVNLKALHLHLPLLADDSNAILAGCFARSCRDARNDTTFIFVPRLSKLCLSIHRNSGNHTLPASIIQQLMGNGAIKQLQVFGASLLDQDGADQDEYGQDA